MRFALVLCAVLLASCDDELYYADGTPWSNPNVPLLTNDALRQHPYLRRQPVDSQEWTRFIQTLNAQDVNVNREPFTPTWFGFSADPTEGLYLADLGSIGVIWTEAQATGTSDDTVFVLSGLPASMRPTSDATVPIMVFDNSAAIAGYAEVESDGEIIFHRAQVSGTNIVLDSAWTAAGSKGIGAGQVMVYPK